MATVKLHIREFKNIEELAIFNQVTYYWSVKESKILFTAPAEFLKAIGF